MVAHPYNSWHYLPTYVSLSASDKAEMALVSTLFFSDGFNARVSDYGLESSLLSLDRSTAVLSAVLYDMIFSLLES